MDAKEYLKTQGIYSLDTKKRYNEVIDWMEGYAAQCNFNTTKPVYDKESDLKKYEFRIYDKKNKTYIYTNRNKTVWKQLNAVYNKIYDLIETESSYQSKLTMDDLEIVLLDPDRTNAISAKQVVDLLSDKIENNKKYREFQSIKSGHLFDVVDKIYAITGWSTSYMPYDKYIELVEKRIKLNILSESIINKVKNLIIDYKNIDKQTNPFKKIK